MYDYNRFYTTKCQKRDFDFEVRPDTGYSAKYLVGYWISGRIPDIWPISGRIPDIWPNTWSRPGSDQYLVGNRISDQYLIGYRISWQYLVWYRISAQISIGWWIYAQISIGYWISEQKASRIPGQIPGRIQDTQQAGYLFWYPALCWISLNIIFQFLFLMIVGKSAWTRVRR